MDLLGSILNSMDKNKPPVVGEQQKKAKKQQEEKFKQRQEEERNQLKKFKEKLEVKINLFLQDDTCPKLSLEPMAKVHRAIVHEISEIAGLSAFSFGEEDVDRHVVIFKKEFTPSNEELNAYRKGLTWNPEKIAKYSPIGNEEESPSVGKPSSSKATATASYINKYERLLGKEVAKDAAKITEINKAYGLVPRENKKDNRSIEQTLNDIRAKKKQKTDFE